MLMQDAGFFASTTDRLRVLAAGASEKSQFYDSSKLLISWLPVKIFVLSFVLSNPAAWHEKCALHVTQSAKRRR
jgi:hypothetical protein